MANNTMRAIRYHDYGGPDRLVVDQVTRPQVQAGSVLVQVKATGVNPMDWKMRSGALRQFMPAQFPATPGIELAGVVDEVGPGVHELQKGQAVYGIAGNANAEYAVVDANSLASKPESLSFDQAASIPVGVLTAKSALDQVDVKPGERVLVLGAAGGVGTFVVQLAHLKGAKVIGTASANNHDYVRTLGAEQVVDYNNTPVETAVHDVDVVVDTVGGDAGVRALRALRRGGRYVTIAGRAPQDEASQLGVRAESVGQRDRARDGETLRQMNELIRAGKLRVQVTNILPLAQARQAHALGETGHGRGRIILHVSD